MPSTKSIILHVTISLILLSTGLYVLIEKRMIIAGKLTGDIYEFNYPNNIIIAVSFFLQAIFAITVLIKKKSFKKINEWVLISALILFVVGVFI